MLACVTFSCLTEPPTEDTTMKTRRTIVIIAIDDDAGDRAA